MTLCAWFCSNSRNPPPAKKRPPAAPKPGISFPKVKAMFDYDATDTDELTFKENDIIEVVKEGKHLTEDSEIAVLPVVDIRY